MSFNAQVTFPPLIVDRAASAALPSEDEVREWARDQAVFVSSVIEGYLDVREAAADAIKAVGARPVLFERFGGRDADPNEAYLSEVRASDVYVGLLGARYGRPLPDRYSATHAEYREAERSGSRLSVWAQEGVEREGPQQSFVDEVRTFDVTGSFRAASDLRTGLETRLREIAAAQLGPWIKLGPFIFRADHIEESKGRAIVRARVRDPAIIAGLRALDDPMRRQETTLSYPGRTLVARPESVSTSTSASRAVAVELTLGVSAPPTPTRINFNGVPWEHLSSQAVGVSWFGEPNPLGLMGGQLEMPDPFAAIAAAEVPEEAVRPIAELLASEVLVLRRGVERIVRFRLGRRIGDRRSLLVCWQDTPRYTNQPADPPVELTGHVQA